MNRLTRLLVILGVTVEVAEEDADRLTERARAAGLLGGAPHGSLNSVRAAEGFPPMPTPDWVLVKGFHDSGTIHGVFGPYTEMYTDWLLRDVLDCSSYNWTKVKLDSGPSA